MEIINANITGDQLAITVNPDATVEQLEMVLIREMFTFAKSYAINHNIAIEKAIDLYSEAVRTQLHVMEDIADG